MWILIVVFHVHSGSSGFSQEFTSQSNCENVKKLLYAERERTGLKTAFCRPK